MVRHGLAIAGVCVALGACGTRGQPATPLGQVTAPPGGLSPAPEDLITAPAPSVLAAVPPTQPLPLGPTDGLVVPAGMRIEAAYGDDAWRLPAGARFGAAAGNLVPAWDSMRLYVVDRTTGQPVAALWHGEQNVTQVAIDATGRQAAALAQDGRALYWKALDAAPVRFTPRRIMVDDRVDPIRRPDGGGMVDVRRYVASDALRDKRAAARLRFTADGRRLIAGFHVWDVRKGGEVFPLRTDEVLVQAGDDTAQIARLIVVVSAGQPSGDSGSLVEKVVMTAYERRHIGGRVESLLARKAFAALPEAKDLAEVLPVPGHEPLGFSHLSSIDVDDGGRIAYVQEGKGWLVRGDGVQPLADGATLKSVTIGDRGTLYAVVNEREGTQIRGVAVRLADDGTPAMRVPGMLVSIARDGRAVLGRDGGVEVWRLAGEPRGSHRSYHPDKLRAIDKGRTAGPRRLVLRDWDGTHYVFIVEESGRRPRTIRIRGDYGSQWALSPDGARGVVAGPDAVHAFSLDDGRILLDDPLTPQTFPSSVAISPQIIAAGDVSGRVRLWRDPTAAPLTLDLGGRADIATALAISPDERYLAIGTGRGRIFLVALNAGVSPAPP